MASDEICPHPALAGEMVKGIPES
jgi:hypothetical protein